MSIKKTVKITLERAETEDRALSIALLNGYQPTLTSDIVTVMEMVEAQAKGYHIIKVLDKNSKGNYEAEVVTGEKETPNTQTVRDFLSKYFQKLIDDDITAKVLANEQKVIAEKRRQEDIKIAQGVKKSVGATVIK